MSKDENLCNYCHKDMELVIIPVKESPDSKPQKTLGFIKVTACTSNPACPNYGLMQLPEWMLAVKEKSEE